MTLDQGLKRGGGENMQAGQELEQLTAQEPVAILLWPQPFRSSSEYGPKTPPYETPRLLTCTSTTHVYEQRIPDLGSLSTAFLVATPRKTLLMNTSLSGIRIPLAVRYATPLLSAASLW